MNEQTSRPVDMPDEVVQALAAGQQMEVGEQSRPRSVTDKDVDTLRSKGGSIESFATLARADMSADMSAATSSTAESSAATSSGAGSRPRDLSAKDVASLVAGKALDISERPVLAAQAR